MINAETVLVAKLLKKHSPSFVLGYLTALSEVNPPNGIDYKYCLELIKKIRK